MQEKRQERRFLSLAVSPREFIIKHLRYLPWIVLCLAIAFTIAWAKLRYSIPYYSAEATMLLRESKHGSGNDKLEELLQDKENINIRNEMEVLRSSVLAKRVVKALGLQTQYYNMGKVKYSVLYREVPFQLDILRQQDSSKPLRIAFSVKGNKSFVLKDSSAEHVFGETFNYQGNQLRVSLTGIINPDKYESQDFSIRWLPVDDAVSMVNGSLGVSIVNNNTSILGLTLLSEHPIMSMEIVNQLMKEYNNSNVEEKNQTSVNTLQFIDERLDTIKRDLSVIERAIQQFSENNKAINLESQTQNYIENVTKSGDQIVEQQVKMSVVNYMINYLSSAQNNNKLVPNVLDVQEPTLIPLINGYNQLQLERQTKLQGMPPTNQIIKNMDLSIDKLRQDIIENLKNVKNAYQIALQSLQTKSHNMESQLLSLPGKGKQLAEISRQQKILEELYKFLLTKKIETSISSASTISNSRVLDAAGVSWTPVKPDKKATYFVAFFFGLAVPIGFIALREYLNDKIESRAELEKLTPVPILGEVGHVMDGETLVAKPGNRSYVAEQFRIIRTNMQFVLNKTERPVILVTSSFSGEGKSFISTNMGSVMSMAGKKTVILELDIRKPKVTAGLDLHNRKGITNYMVSNLDPEELPVAVPGIDNLYVIPCGPLPPNPAELLMDSKLDKLIEWARHEFDVVIMDSAPVGLVSDSMILSRFADCTLYIVRQQYTYKKQISFVNEMHEAGKFNRMFLVLNDVKIQKGYGNYYGYGYGYGYGYAGKNEYFEEVSKKSWWQRLKKNRSI